jgi:N4-gp56 family major capsid protein
MANTKAATGLTVQEWDDLFWTEFFFGNRFKTDMGSSSNNIIHVKEDLATTKGKTMTWALVNRLAGAGVTGNDTLEGNEEDMTSRSFTVDIIQRRHGVLVPHQEEQYSAIPLRNAGKEVLMNWTQENTRDRIITALGSINGTAYGSADSTARDVWAVDNVDRVLFGALVANYSATHATAMSNIDNTDDKFTASAASLMKRIAQSASPKIRPVRSESSGRFFYKCYVPSLVFRDLKDDSTITQAQRDVNIRMQGEKLFKGGDIEWDGIIFEEIQDIEVLSGVGAGSIDTAPVYLMGQQAVGYAISERWNSVTQETDYKDKMGVAMREMGNFGKMTFGTGSSDTSDLKDHGMVTGFFASVADS